MKKQPVPKSREGKRSMTVWLDPRVVKAAKMAALKDDLTFEAVVAEALRAECKRRGVDVR
jgi:hypothetical protein